MIGKRLLLATFLALSLLSNLAMAGPLEQMLEIPALKLAPEYARHLQMRMGNWDFDKTLAAAVEAGMFTEEEFTEAIETITDNLHGLKEKNETALKDFALNYMIFIRLSKNGYFYAAQEQVNYLAIKALDYSMSLRANKKFYDDIDEKTFSQITLAMISKVGFIRSSERHRLVSNFSALYQSWTSEEFQKRFEKMTTVKYDSLKKGNPYFILKILGVVALTTTIYFTVSSAIAHNNPTQLLPLAPVLSGPFTLFIKALVERFKLRKRRRSDLDLAVGACNQAFYELGVGIRNE